MADIIKSLVNQTVRVSLETLATHPRNPRIGNVDEIAKSLEKNGLYRPLVVQRSSNYILAGNHTFKAAKKLGWTHIDVVYLDVNDRLGRRIMIADNKTSDLGTYDNPILADVLQEFKDDLEGTGYSDAEMNSIIANMPDISEMPEGDNEGAFTEADLAVESDLGEPRFPSVRERYIEERPEQLERSDANRGAPSLVPGREEEIERITVQAELQATLEIKSQEGYFGENYWQIPDLRTDMLMDDIPDDTVAWGGNEMFKGWPDTPDRWYVYNFGLGGITGLPTERAILSFFTWDDKFQSWWETPAYQLSRAMTRGIKYAIVPDFSTYPEMPRALHLFNYYRGQWLGRYFQECGIKIIPRIQFGDPTCMEYAVLGTPVGCPLLAISQQNFGKTKEQQEAAEKENSQLIKETLGIIKPKKLILYGNSKRLERIINERLAGITTPIHVVPSYSDVRKQTGVFGAQEGSLNKLSPNERRKIRQKAKQDSGLGGPKEERVGDEQD